MEVSEFFRVVYAVGLGLVLLALAANLVVMVAVVRSGENRTRRYLRAANWREDGFIGKVMLGLARTGVQV